MDPGDSKNVYGNPRVQHPNFTLKMSYLKYFSVSFRRCNLEVSPAFLESIGIIEHCCAFGFLGTYHPLPYRRFKRTVCSTKMMSWAATMFLTAVVILTDAADALDFSTCGKRQYTARERRCSDDSKLSTM